MSFEKLKSLVFAKKSTGPRTEASLRSSWDDKWEEISTLPSFIVIALPFVDQTRNCKTVFFIQNSISIRISIRIRDTSAPRIGHEINCGGTKILVVKFEAVWKFPNLICFLYKVLILYKTDVRIIHIIMNSI